MAALLRAPVRVVRTLVVDGRRAPGTGDPKSPPD